MKSWDLVGSWSRLWPQPDVGWMFLSEADDLDPLKRYRRGGVRHVRLQSSLGKRQLLNTTLPGEDRLKCPTLFYDE